MHSCDRCRGEQWARDLAERHNTEPVHPTGQYAKRYPRFRTNAVASACEAARAFDRRAHPELAPAGLRRFRALVRSYRPERDPPTPEKAHEEVDGESPDIDLVLQGRPAVQKLALHLAAEAQHLLGVATDLLERGDDLLLGPQWRDEEPDHRLEVHGERGHRGGEPLPKHLPALFGDGVHGPRAFPDVLALRRDQPHGREPLHLPVDSALCPGPHIAEVADPLPRQLVGGPRTQGELGQDGIRGRRQGAAGAFSGP
jgi:hypothetical protein